MSALGQMDVTRLPLGPGSPQAPTILLPEVINADRDKETSQAQGLSSCRRPSLAKVKAKRRGRRCAAAPGARCPGTASHSGCTGRSVPPWRKETQTALPGRVDSDRTALCRCLVYFNNAAVTRKNTSSGRDCSTGDHQAGKSTGLLSAPGTTHTRGRTRRPQCARLTRCREPQSWACNLTVCPEAQPP